jgi:segregation and condensation protein B
MTDAPADDHAGAADPNGDPMNARNGTRGDRPADVGPLDAARADPCEGQPDVVPGGATDTPMVSAGQEPPTAPGMVSTAVPSENAAGIELAVPAATEADGGLTRVPGETVPGPATPPSREPDEAALRLAEAVVFASVTPVGARALSQILPDDMDSAAVIAALRLRYEGRGIELAEIGGGLQFRTAADLGPHLRKVVQVPRRLPRVALETLAIVAYHQPVTRPEIEDMRGASLSQQTLDVLLENDLIVARGRKETPGRPTLWGTTPKFLEYFGLRDIRELPRRQDLLLETVRPEEGRPEGGRPEGGRPEEKRPEEKWPEEKRPEGGRPEAERLEDMPLDKPETKARNDGVEGIPNSPAETAAEDVVDPPAA